MLEIFSNTYNTDAINNSIKLLREKLAKIQQDNAVAENPQMLEYMKKLATLAERALSERIGNNKLFGLTKQLLPTHICDDVLGGLDYVLINNDLLNRDPDKRQSLTGIDATLANINSPTYEQKISRILVSIERNNLPTLYYQQDAKGTPLGEKTVPRLILHIDKKTLDQLLLPNNNNDHHGKLGHSILRQLIEQTRVLIEYAAAHNSNITSHLEATLKSLTAAAHTTSMPAYNDELPETLRLRSIIAHRQKSELSDAEYWKDQ